MGIFLIYLHVCKYFCNVLIACKLAGIKENWRQIIRFVCSVKLSIYNLPSFTIIGYHFTYIYISALFLFLRLLYTIWSPFPYIIVLASFYSWNLFLSILISIASYISFFNKLISASISFTIISLCPQLQKLNKWKGDNGKTIKRYKQNFTKLLIKRVWKINLF